MRYINKYETYTEFNGCNYNKLTQSEIRLQMQERIKLDKTIENVKF